MAELTFKGGKTKIVVLEWYSPLCFSLIHFTVHLDNR